MTQEQELIEKLSADRRKLVWETERLKAEIVNLKRQNDTLTELLAEATAEVEFLVQHA